MPGNIHKSIKNIPVFTRSTLPFIVILCTALLGCRTDGSETMALPQKNPIAQAEAMMLLHNSNGEPMERMDIDGLQLRRLHGVKTAFGDATKYRVNWCSSNEKDKNGYVQAIREAFFELCRRRGGLQSDDTCTAQQGKDVLFIVRHETIPANERALCGRADPVQYRTLFIEPNGSPTNAAYQQRISAFRKEGT
jgi:hypothetical protein